MPKPKISDDATNLAPTAPAQNQGGDHAGEGPGGRRVDPPGQDDNAHSQRPDDPPGGHADGESVAGTDSGDVLQGGDGADTLDGGAGDDTLDGGKGPDQLTGGEGDDVFVATDPAHSASKIDSVTDFTHDEDTISFSDGFTADESTFITATADSFHAARSDANSLMSDGQYDVVAVQVGDNVIVFADVDDDNKADSSILLVGRSLSDVGYHDFG